MLNNKFNAKSIKDDEVKKLYEIAKSVAIPKVINEQMCSGGVGAAVLSKTGNIYTGVCIGNK